MGLAPLAAQDRRGLKIFMLCDMEGSSGIFTREQAWYWENGVREQVAAEARELFTADVDPIKLGKEDVFIVASSLRGSNASKHATLGKLFGALKRRAGDSGLRPARLP